MGSPSIRLIHGDCLEVLPTLDADSIDAVVTDPPYGIGDGAAFVLRAGREVASGAGKGWNVLVPWSEWVPLAARALKPGGYFVTFHDLRSIRQTLDAIESAGLSVWSRFWIVKAAPPPCPRKAFMSGIEEAVIAVKPGGPREWHGGGATPNYWRGLTPNRLNEAVHPTQKPDGAIERLIRALTPEGGTVLDPFAGSGTAGVVAARIGRSAILIEKDDAHFATAQKRVAEDMPLFGSRGVA